MSSDKYVVRDVLGFDLVVDFVRSGEGSVIGMTLNSGRVKAIRFTKQVTRG